ncbi:transmembrane and immunoglobulin domain-containing protein 2 isoform X1 [Ursus maritimus]|uniref:transmembrane and immunoglobulin domain-containing protein 2 isoform X1 n=1 Tax=Ursus maritimus TaxID=29073 RepID=UPI001ADFF8AD|nr:transmembrane and immunoglobulin domain-containing protein 2 isoform X1 [Ursus maritimus]
MESLGSALVFLVQFWVLQGATGLRVQQEPKELQVMRGSQVTLACQVIQSQAWERLRVEWTKDGVSLCEPHITNGSLSLRVCGPRRQLSWKPPGKLTLQLDRVSLNDSGHYVCGVAVEIPKLEVERGNGTQLLVKKDGLPTNQTSTDSGLLVAPLVAGGVAVAAIALSACVWGRRRSRREDSGHPLYGNVLYQPRGAPKKTKAWRVEGKVLDSPRANQKSQSFYSISFPQPPSPQQRLAQKPCPSPRSSHPISTVGDSPNPRPSGQQWPRGLLQVGRGLETPEKTPSHQWPRENVTDLPKRQGVQQPSPRPRPHYCNAGFLPHP